MPFSWDSDLKAKTGQKAKEKKGDVVVDDKALEYTLRIAIVGVGDDLDAVAKEIIDDIDGLAKINLVFDGDEATLKKSRKRISELIAKYGGQEKLDLHLTGEQAEQTS